MIAKTHDPAFNAILKISQAFPKRLSPDELHGFLTGVVVVGDIANDYPWLNRALGVSDFSASSGRVTTVQEDFWDYLGDIADSFEIDVFTPVTSTALNHDESDFPVLQQWVRGFLHSIELMDRDWKALTETNVELTRCLLALNVIVDPEKFGPEAFDKPVDISDPSFRDELCASVTPIVINMWEQINRLESDDDSAEFLDEFLSELPRFAQDELAQLSDEALSDLIPPLEDRVPLSIIDECAAREDFFASLFREYLNNEEIFRSDADDTSPGIWPSLHAIMICGRIHNADAAHALLNALTMQSRHPDHDLWDWIGGFWPALFGEKVPWVAEALQRVAQDDEVYEITRYLAYEILLAYYDKKNLVTEQNKLLEQLKDRIASQPRTKSLRYQLAQLLIDVPRPSHRSLLDQLVHDQKYCESGLKHFDQADIDKAYCEGGDPGWSRFTDPWQFYDPHAIARRQLRWLEESRFDESYDESFVDDVEESGFEEDYDDIFSEDIFDHDRIPVHRDAPKIGRNDPCPCGSGKKYKKCCMQ